MKTLRGEYASSDTLPQAGIDSIFAAIDLLQSLSDRHNVDVALLEAQRDAMLSELLDRNPHEGVGEVMHALSVLYRDRSITTYDGDLEVTQFGTRDADNTRLDDRFALFRRDGEVVGLVASYTDAPDLGYEIMVEGEQVRVNVLHGTYHIPLNPHEVRPDGSPNTYTTALRDFVLRALTTATIARKREQTDADEADDSKKTARSANLSARAMLLAEIPH